MPPQILFENIQKILNQAHIDTVDYGAFSLQGNHSTIKHGHLLTIKLGNEGIKVRSHHINDLKLQRLLLCGGNAFSDRFFCPFHIAPMSLS